MQKTHEKVAFLQKTRRIQGIKFKFIPVFLKAFSPNFYFLPLTSDNFFISKILGS